MLHAYRLAYPMSQHAPPQLWEYEQPHMHNLIVSARTFGHIVVQRYFKDWDDLDGENVRFWETYYRPKPLFADTESWEDWMPEYRQLVIEVQEIWEGCRKPGKTSICVRHDKAGMQISFVLVTAVKGHYPKFYPDKVGWEGRGKPEVPK